MVRGIVDALDAHKAQSFIDTVINEESSCRALVTLLMAMDCAHRATGGTREHFMDSASEIAFQYYAKKGGDDAKLDTGTTEGV